MKIFGDERSWKTNRLDSWKSSLMNVPLKHKILILVYVA